MTRLHPDDLADQRANPNALDPRPIWDRIKRILYAALIAHAVIWCGVQGYLTVDYVWQRTAAIEGGR